MNKSSSDKPQFRHPFNFTPLPSTSTMPLPYDTPTLPLFPIRPQNPGGNSELQTPILDHDDNKTPPVSLDLSLSINHNQRPLHNINKTIQFPIITEKKTDSDPSLWRIKKVLTSSDIGNLSRLLVTSEDVHSSVLPHWDEERVKNLLKGEALKVRVWDFDTKTEHGLVLKRWSSNGSFVFNNSWIKCFVKRRGLKLGDQIGLFWDQGSSRFNFSLLKHA